MTKIVPLTCTGHSRPVTHLQFSGPQGGYTFVSGDKAGHPILRNGITGDWIGTFIGHKGAIWCVRITYNGLYVATASADFSVGLWDAITGDQLVNLPHKHVVRSVDIWIDEGASMPTLLISGSQDKLLRIWNLSTREIVKEWHAGDFVRAVVWISRGLVVSVGFQGDIKWWSVAGDEPKCINSLNVGIILGQVEYVDGNLLIPAGKSVYIVVAASGEIAKHFGLDYEVSCASISKDVKKFATGSAEDTWLRIHSAETGSLLETHKGHHGPVHTVAYSPDGKLLASGSEDGTVRLWKIVSGVYGLWQDSTAVHLEKSRPERTEPFTETLIYQ